MGSFAARIGLAGLAIAILVALLAVQTVRLEGFKVWPLSIEGARAKVDRLEGELQAILQAQKAAEGAQLAVNDAAARIYRDVAERIDDDAEQARTGALDDAERFIASSRVRCPAPGGLAGQADSTARDRGARDREAVPDPPELDGAVAVPAEDVRICTVNTLQAEAARSWALDLEAASKPVD